MLPTVTISLKPSDLGGFFSVLQEGVILQARTGVLVGAFLTEQLGIDPDYVANRISTVFLDGDVCDSLEQATLHDGAVLALSAAMPGVLGATVRRGGVYAAMRASITHLEDKQPAAKAASEGTFRLKLFNLLLAELGPLVLARGIIVDPETARAALPNHATAALPEAPGRFMLRVSFTEAP